ncbi:MAG: hypothetical protein OXB98_02600 [Bryobacterales bacterium]|nr:hypothetical protein [Bryobacterales bacterium]
MRALGNVLWHFPFLGFLSAAVTYLLGLLLTATVIAAPIGLGVMELGKFMFVPFGRALVKKSDLVESRSKAWQTYSTVIMILYLPFGLTLSVVAALQVIGLCITVVGIPVGIVIAKSIGTYFNPVGKKCVSQAVADELERRKALAQFD